MKQRNEYIEINTALLHDCDSIEMLDLIMQLLIKTKAA